MARKNDLRLDRTVNVGKTDDGRCVILHVRYGPDPLNLRATVQSVQHEWIPCPDILSITGDVLYKGSESIEFGQIQDRLSEITKPAGSLTIEDLGRLVSLWDRWHLNTMRAECAHMDLSTVPDDLPGYAPGEPTRSEWMLDNLVCDQSGYRYGRAWLSEAVPPEVVDEIATLLDKGKELTA